MGIKRDFGLENVQSAERLSNYSELTQSVGSILEKIKGNTYVETFQLFRINPIGGAQNGGGGQVREDFPIIPN